MPLSSDVLLVDCPQRTPEWWTARIGRVTSSRVGDVFTKPRSKTETESKTRRDYKVSIALEQITGKPAEDMDQWKSPWVARGVGREAEAKAAYEAYTARAVWTPGFLSHRTVQTGCSVDGVVGDFARVLELKVPKPAVHLEYLRAGRVPDDYEHQVLMHFAISGAPFVDFVSYCPDMPAALQLFVLEVPRPPVEAMTAFSGAVDRFLKDVATEKAAIEALMVQRAAA